MVHCESVYGKSGYCSRPDLAYTVSIVSRFMGGLKYTRADRDEDALEGYVDADYAGNVDTRKSLSGFVFTLYDKAISWKANQQSVVALSTTQAKYIALVEGVKEAILLKGMIVYHERTKHIDIRLHFVRDMIESKEIVVEKVASEENPANVFTKSLPRSRFKHYFEGEVLERETWITKETLFLLITTSFAPHIVVFHWCDFVRIHNNKCIVMHDLVNDLAKSVSHEFCLQIEGDSLQDIIERTRHICCYLDWEDGARVLNHISNIKGLRSFLVVPLPRGYHYKCFMISNNLQSDLFSKLKYLRMLSLCGCELRELSSEIGNLKLLRYLNLAGTLTQRFPDSICKLYKLETLILEGCYYLTTLPSKFYKLVSLRHLNLKGCHIKKMPKQMGSLNHLQTLSHFVVGEEKNGSNIQELDAAGANLKDKKHVEELNMEWSYKFNNNGRELDVFEALQPNSNLKRLTISEYKGNGFPNWISHLSNLVSLQLQDYGLCSDLPALGQLPSLKDLSISRCDGIMIIGEEFYNNSSTNVSFRSLEVLKFEEMDNWEEWFCLEGFPLLKELYITSCHELKRAQPQNLPSLQKLWINNCMMFEEWLCPGEFPLLKEISVNVCYNLKRVLLPQHLPSLQKMKIGDCYELEASIPKGDSIVQLYIQSCGKILVNELPTSLKKFVLCKNQYVEFTAIQFRRWLDIFFVRVCSQCINMTGQLQSMTHTMILTKIGLHFICCQM
ncbi:Ty1/Copia-like polyprotein/retrotransposon [Medicago truncatula]|uniref:Ty1/Copia-like polyprotein/retrotransposon n=1 Tax=Medicago truncatula TaxID=3880 RepID=G7J1K6_MEDTR|nr:Ty1/Copia-like polyprotein/retrotransposon [Medicago truncatula]